MGLAYNKTLLFAFLLLTVAVLAGCPSPSDKAKEADRKYNPDPVIGEQKQVVSPEGRAYLAMTPDDFAELAKAAKANDSFGILELLQQGKVITVTAKTRVLVLENKTDGDRAFLTKVRILDGEHIGKAAWIMTSSLFKLTS